jgi:hypothetical protein
MFYKRFLEQGSKVNISKKEIGKLPKKDVLQKQQEDSRLNNYVQTISRI